MSYVSFTDLRQGLARYLDEVRDGRVPLTVTQQGKGEVVILSAEEYAGIEETIHLLRSPANARRLLRSIGSAASGEVAEHDLSA